MYAVIKTGGKQHRVKPGDVIEVELIHSSSDTVTFTPLMVVDDEGATHVGREATKARVTAKLVGEQKGDKVKIFKYRPKTGYAKRAGHRQMYTLIEIQDVSLGGASKTSAGQAQKTKKSDAAAKTEKPDKVDKTEKNEKTEKQRKAEPAGDAPTEPDQPSAEDVGAVVESEAPDSADAAVSEEARDDAAGAGGPEA